MVGNRSTLLLVQLLVRLAFGALLYSLLTIGPVWLMSDTLAWPRGWLAIAILAGTQLLVGVWLWRADPDLLRERATFNLPATLADRFATLLIFLLILGWFLLNPIDVHRLQLLPAPPSAVSLWGGTVLFALGMGLVTWTLRENSFAATTVKIQRERDQRVIDTGPYAYVRHPMYAGIPIMFAGLSLIMESSFMTLAAFPMFTLGLLPRIFIEEAILRRELTAYADYLKRVRWRLIPGIF